MTSGEWKNFATFWTVFILFSLSAVAVSEVIKNRQDKSEHPMSKQNVVCDLVYGVQYFEHNGSLTVRLNHEGTPIRCFEEETK